MDENAIKIGAIVLVALIVFYLGYDTGGDAVAAQYTEAGQSLLEILVRGRK